MDDFIYITSCFILPIIFLVIIIEGAFSNPVNWTAVGIGSGGSLILGLLNFILYSYPDKYNKKDK